MMDPDAIDARRVPSSPPKAARSARTKNVQRLGYRRIVQLLIYMVIVPTAVLLTLGIILMFLGEAKFNLIIGIFTVTFVGLVVLGVILVWVFVAREANLSELQADFVSKVSHELKTPLTAVRLFAETLKRRRGDEKLEEECVRQILDETDRLTAKIDRLLDWGRMEAGRKVYDLRRENLDSIVTDVIGLPLFVSSEDRVIETEFANDLPEIEADRAALVDAIGNLLSNATKYGGTPVRIRIRVYAEGEWVCVAVRDNGAGIPRAEQKRIFQKFYRIDDRLSRAKEGSGLGLAIVSHVVRAHNGEIRLESELGTGSTFILMFPKSIESGVGVRG